MDERVEDVVNPKSIWFQRKSGLLELSRYGAQVEVRSWGKGGGYVGVSLRIASARKLRDWLNENAKD